MQSRQRGLPRKHCLILHSGDCLISLAKGDGRKVGIFIPTLAAIQGATVQGMHVPSHTWAQILSWHPGDWTGCAE